MDFRIGLQLILAAALCCGARCHAQLPEHVQATVLVCNPTPCCSGTLISRGTLWARGVCAAHCFAGRIGGEFSITFADGRTAPAVLTHIDRHRDAALFRVSAVHVSAVAPVPVTQSEAAIYEMCGYPGPDWNRPLKRYRVSLTPTPEVAPRRTGETAGRTRWALKAWGEPIRGGCSGGGLHANGQLVGIVSDADTRSPGIAYASTHDQLTQFLQGAATGNTAEFGDWRAAPRPVSLAPRAPSGTIVVAAPNCPNGRCPLPTDTPPAPEYFGRQGAGEPPPDRDELAFADIYSGTGKKPADLNTIRKRTRVLDESRHELADLQRELEDLKRRPVQHGRDGRDGQDGRIIERPMSVGAAGHPLLGALAFPTAFCLVLGVLLLLRARAAANATAR